MKIENISGECLCGAITVHLEAVSGNLGVCHCSMCRKWSGGPFIAADSLGEVTFSNPQDITRYPSSDWAERGFCRRCGSHLFYYYKENNAYFIPAGLLNFTEHPTLKTQIFIDEKPGYYEFANHTELKTGAEFLAQFEQAGVEKDESSA